MPKTLRAWLCVPVVAFVGQFAYAQGVPPTVPPWFDGFEAYAAGTDPTQPSLGGWENWDLVATTGTQIRNTRSLTGAQSFFNGGNGDAVQKFQGTAGQITRLVAHVYVPGAGQPDEVTAETWFLLLNTFDHGAAMPKLWSLQLGFNPGTGFVRYSGGPLNGLSFPFATDQWMRLVVDLDLAAPPLSPNAQVTLDPDVLGPLPGIPMGPPFDWSEGASAGGIDELQAIDLWANDQHLAPNPNGGAYYDDMSVIFPAAGGGGMGGSNAPPPAAPPWSEDFESYAPGDNPTFTAMGGWENWDLTLTTGSEVSAARALGGAHSFFNGGYGDIVHRFTGTAGGIWRFASNLYVPGGGQPDELTAETLLILLNTFGQGASQPKLWSLQLAFDPLASNVRFVSGTNSGLTTPFAKDQWMTVAVDVDTTQPALSNNAQVLVDTDGPSGPNSLVAFGPPFDWSEGVSPGGIDEIQCVDLWSNVQFLAANPAGGTYYDDLRLEQPPTTGTSFCTAKTGLTCGTPAIAIAGTSSASATSGFVVSAAPARSNKSGILLYNQATAAAFPFQGGFLCVSPMGLRRAGPTNSQGMCPPGANCSGVFGVDMNAFAQFAWTVPNCGGGPSGIPQSSPPGFLSLPGTSVHAQFWGRDSLATGSLVSDGISWVIGP